VIDTRARRDKKTHPLRDATGHRVSQKVGGCAASGMAERLWKTTMISAFGPLRRVWPRRPHQD